ncbi:MAG: hypothetical protein QOG80_1816 [Pseudonocardiales bacterium]|jgi:hypothetical protein|nr:hypothetical protein [Pseudonocardiales bacterium]
MKASDLIGLAVHDGEGQYLGIVIDLRCAQDGPLRGAMQAPRVAALIVSDRHTGSLLGYERRNQQGPWLIRMAVQILHRHAVLIPWNGVADYGGPIRLHSGFHEILPLPCQP